ncbi:MAG: hypothetical protein ACI32C_03595 [Candidatus Enteromonas sp.]
MGGEVNKLLNSIPKDHIDYPVFSLFCYLGCRLGEFLGLQWKCLDENAKSIAICQQIIYLNGIPVLSDELKTNESYRVDALDQDTFDLLMRYKATLNNPKPDDFIFPSPLG